MLWSTNPEKLSNKEGLMGDAWVSLERGNRIVFIDKLGEGEIGSRRDQLGLTLREKIWTGSI